MVQPEKSACEGIMLKARQLNDDEAKMRTVIKEVALIFIRNPVERNCFMGVISRDDVL